MPTSADTEGTAMAYNLDNYEPVEVRLERFWEKYPNGRTHTAVLEKTENSILMIGSIYAERNDLNPIATGIAEEIKSNSGVNRDAWVENCETSALGRALANGGFAAKGKRPSKEEMEKVARRQEQPVVAWTDEQKALAVEALEQVAGITSVAELKLFYQGCNEANLLDIPTNGTTIKKAVADRKKELEATK
jgi:hypothetical protein